ncbi:hypothetical protein KIPB_010511 [Kipferlia bialata]|uniref:Uncharacterized protein n=1 Tax=Kipferlia bialata TaxID=797122 RepID=A0A9K3D4K0_9EUKA|nr:hypothetical protein KIPB_010511 [Kipferlia bialata]|eukprot:g10511.t1
MVRLHCLVLLCVLVSVLCRGCYFDSFYGHCLGDCYEGTACLMLTPGECSCSGCAFDLHFNNCYGDCVKGACLLVPGPTNTTCSCTDCGWYSPAKDHCDGWGCLGTSECMQTTADGGCECTADQCIYDFAEQRCRGLCPDSNFVDYVCRETSHEHCTCVQI